MALGVALGLLTACGPQRASDVGAQLFNLPGFSLSEANPFSCAACHQVDEADPRILAGGSLAGVTARPSFWGGYVVSPLDATNVCVSRFMRGGLLTRDEPRSRALYEYLRTLGPQDDAPAVPFTIVENVVTLSDGDVSRGGDVYQRACAECHGAPHTGEGRLDDGISIIPEASAAFAAQLGYPVELVIIEKVRHGVFFNIGGTMPPYSLEVLPDDDLAALISYLVQ